jgi:hypothetical protein
MPSGTPNSHANKYFNMILLLSDYIGVRLPFHTAIVLSNYRMT